jgi:hypothetical protein
MAKQITQLPHFAPVRLDMLIPVVDSTLGSAGSGYATIGDLFLGHDYVLNVKNYGAQGNSITDDTAAFNAWIAALNFQATNFGSAAGYIPAGVYMIPAGLTQAITSSSISIEGAGDTSTIIRGNTGSMFRFGSSVSGLIVDLTVKKLSVRYVFAAPAAATDIVFRCENAARISVSDVYLEYAPRVAYLGESAARYASGISFRNVRGSVNNHGQPAISCRYGAGLTLTDCSMYVAGPLAPVNPAAMTTVAGTVFIDCSTNAGAFWDTIMLNGGLFERFDYGIYVRATAGVVYQAINAIGTFFDYCATTAVYLEAAVGGAVSNVLLDSCWLVGWSGACLDLQGVGSMNGVTLNNSDCLLTSLAHVNNNYTGTAQKHLKITNNRFSACNRVGLANASIFMNPGTKGFTITGNTGNFDTTSAGFPFRAPWGIQILADCDDYLVADNRMEGSAGGYIISANAVGSSLRRVRNNVGSGYAGAFAIALPASTVAYVNKTPHDIEVFITGGTVTVIKKNAITTGMITGMLLLSPNDSFAVTYTVAPSVVANVLA